MTESSISTVFTVDSTKEYFGLDSKWLTLGADGGERIHYHEAGSGHPVILLHGSAMGVSSAANWWRTIPALADVSHVYAPDLSGYGWTEVPDSSYYSVAQWSDQVARFIDAIGVGPSVLVGNSLGGRIGLQVAIDHPDKVSGVATMGSPALGHKRTAVINSHTAPKTTREGIGKVMADLAADGFVIPEELLDFRFQMATMPGAAERWQEVVAARNKSVADTPLTAEALAAVTVPALILHGAQDKVVTVDDSLNTARALPNADLIVYSNCGHWVQLEREDDFVTAVRSLITKAANLTTVGTR